MAKKFPKSVSQFSFSSRFDGEITMKIKSIALFDFELLVHQKRDVWIINLTSSKKNQNPSDL